MTFWGYHTLLASNGVSYIAGRDGLAKVRWYSGNIIDLTSDDSHPGSLLTGCHSGSLSDHENVRGCFGLVR